MQLQSCVVTTWKLQRKRKIINNVGLLTFACTQFCKRCQPSSNGTHQQDQQTNASSSKPFCLMPNKLAFSLDCTRCHVDHLRDLWYGSHLCTNWFSTNVYVHANSLYLLFLRMAASSRTKSDICRRLSQALALSNYNFSTIETSSPSSANRSPDA